MTTKTRLYKAISGLKEIIERNIKSEKFIFSKDEIIIDNSSSQLLAIAIISMMLFIPFGLIIYYLLSDKTSSIIFWLVLLEIMFAYDFYKSLRGNTTLTINTKEKYIDTNYKLSILRKLFPCNRVSFSEITKVDLIIKSVSVRNQWYQLIVFDQNNKSIVLSDFSKTYPESLISTKVKFLIEVIIWTERQSTNNTV